MSIRIIDSTEERFNYANFVQNHSANLHELTSVLLSAALELCIRDTFKYNSSRESLKSKRLCRSTHKYKAKNTIFVVVVGVEWVVSPPMIRFSKHGK